MVRLLRDFKASMQRRFSWLVRQKKSFQSQLNGNYQEKEGWKNAIFCAQILHQKLRRRQRDKKSVEYLGKKYWQSKLVLAMKLESPRNPLFLPFNQMIKKYKRGRRRKKLAIVVTLAGAKRKSDESW